jgi:hypothetical protein
MYYLGAIFFAGLAFLFLTSEPPNTVHAGPFIVTVHVK